MSAPTTASLADLYEADETAWLEVMSRLAAERRVGEFDFDNLSEFLDSMARRDKKEAVSRLIVLLTHVLKWEYQPGKQTGSWRATIREQRRALRADLESGTLRNHAAAVFAECYRHARKQAADETDLPPSAFPVSPPWDLDEVLTDPPEPE